MTSMPSRTSPKTVCFPSSHGQAAAAATQVGYVLAYREVAHVDQGLRIGPLRAGVLVATGFGISLDSVVLLVTDFVTGSGFAAGATAGVAALVLLLWYGLPVWDRLRRR